MVKRQRTKKR